MVEVRIRRCLGRVSVPHDGLDMIDDLSWSKHQVRRVVGVKFCMLLHHSVLLVVAAKPVTRRDSPSIRPSCLNLHRASLLEIGSSQLMPSLQFVIACNRDELGLTLVLLAKLPPSSHRYRLSIFTHHAGAVFRAHCLLSVVAHQLGPPRLVVIDHSSCAVLLGVFAQF